MGHFTASALAAWIGVTLVLGGSAALATGRAIAHGWRPYAATILPMLGLSCATAFLCYALFGVSVLPAGAIIANGASDPLAMLSFLTPWLIGFVALLAFAFAGWRMTRSRQMRRQYPFLLEKSSLPGSGESGHSVAVSRRSIAGRSLSGDDA